MANEVAQRLGYTNREAVSGKHIAMNMSLTNAIRMVLVVNPKLVSCAYSLKTDGSLDKLKGTIDQIEDVQDRNEKLEEYEDLRRNIENAEGIPEILQANVRKGGKYIVFLPVIEDLEDADGNIIGRKKGKDKIADYERQIAEYFRGSDIVPNFHSMLGKYGDKENARRLEEFQNSNSEETEFLLVMNKANEGLHLDKLDGMIWLRAMDENSRILYLQQLGRVIYSEDPDNPTKDEDRPVVIDLVNNTLKVNWENEITEQDDIQMLNLILDWSERHNGTLPDINSSNKEETGYASVLKEIQNKYKGYLENEFDGLNEKQIEEVREIIKLGSQIDLWQIELPNKLIKGKEGKAEEFGKKKDGLFKLTGVLQDFIKLESETNEIEGRTAIEHFIETLKQLKAVGVDVSKLVYIDTIETLAKKSEINVEEIKKIGLNPNDRIGRQKGRIVSAYRGIGRNKPPTKEQVKELLTLGIGLEKQDTAQEFIETLEQLKAIGVDVSRISFSDTMETLAKKSGIDVEKIKKIGLNPNDRIGRQKVYIASAYRGKGKGKSPTQEQVEELLALGISLEKQERDTVQEFIETLEQLQTIGVDVSRISSSDTVETLAKKSEIDVEEIKRMGLNPNDRIGKQKVSIASAYRGKGKYTPPSPEQVEELLALGISLEKQDRDTVQEFIETLEQLQTIGVDVSRISSSDTVETLAKKSEIDVEEIKRMGLNPNDRIGRQKVSIASAYRGKGNYTPPSPEQVEELLALGISLEKQEQDTVQEFIETLEQLQTIGVDVSKLVYIDTIETLAKKSEIDVEEIKRTGLNPNDRIGRQKVYIVSAYRGKVKGKPPTQEQVEELLALGIGLEKQDTVQKFIETLEQLKAIGVDVSRISFSDTTETLAKKSEINVEEIKKIGLNPNDRIGRQKGRIVSSYRGKGNLRAPTKEQVKELLALGISLEKKSRTSKEIAEASISSLTNIDMSDREDAALKELVERTKEGGMNLYEQS